MGSKQKFTKCSSPTCGYKWSYAWRYYCKNCGEKLPALVPVSGTHGPSGAWAGGPPRVKSQDKPATCEPQPPKSELEALLAAEALLRRHGHGTSGACEAITKEVAATRAKKLEEREPWKRQQALEQALGKKKKAKEAAVAKQKSLEEQIAKLAEEVEATKANVTELDVQIHQAEAQVAAARAALQPETVPSPGLPLMALPAEVAGTEEAKQLLARLADLQAQLQALAAPVLAKEAEEKAKETDKKPDKPEHTDGGGAETEHKQEAEDMEVSVEDIKAFITAEKGQEPTDEEVQSQLAFYRGFTAVKRRRASEQRASPYSG